MSYKMRLFDLVKRHEGLKLKPYTDSRGFLTIGYGHRCPPDMGPIDKTTAELLLEGDIAHAEVIVDNWLMTAGLARPHVDGLTDARRAVLVDMAFNLGATGLHGFRELRKAVLARDWDQAATEMLKTKCLDGRWRKTKWARQVGRRAKEDAKLMRTGTWE